MPTEHANPPTSAPMHGGVARLVEAERGWQLSLDVARSMATQLVDRATADAQAREAGADAEIRAAVAAHEQALQRALDDAVQHMRTEFATNVDRYALADATLVAQLADAVAARAPWFADTEAAR